MYFVCCKILGIKPGADEETIKAAYRKSAKELVIYIAFHILFLFVGFWLIYHSAYDILFHEPYDKIHKFSAYFTVVFGFFFGIMLTGTFLVTGISFIRKRM
jgi:uncharacterized membrane protein